MSIPVTRMWEARTHPDTLVEAVRWAAETVVRSAEEAGAASAEMCYATGPTPRVVVITRWADRTEWREPATDDRLIARAHGWSFVPVDAHEPVVTGAGSG